MVEVFSVESVLTLSDRQMLAGLRAVGKELRTLGTEAAKLQTTLKAMGSSPMIAGAGLGQMQKMRAAMAAVAAEAGKARTALAAMEINPAAVSSASALSRSLGTATTRAAALRNELARLPGGFGPGGRAPGAHGPGGRGPFHTRFGAGPIDGRFALGPAEVGALAIGGTLFEAAKMAGSEQLALFYTVLAGGMDPNGAQGKEYADKIKAAAQAASIGTIYSRLDVEKMMPGIAGMSLKPLADTLPFMPLAIRFGELEKQLGKAQGHEWSSEESSAAAIRIGHLMAITDPSKFGPVLDLVAPTTMSSHTSPAQLAKILQYMASSARGSGMNPSEVLNLAALGSTYLSGTTSGTGLNMVLQGLMPRGGPGAGTKIQQNWMKRRELLEKFNFLDPRTHQLYRDDKGGVELPLLKHLAEFQAAHPNDAYGFYTQLFGGQRGARAAYEMGQPGVLAQALEMQRRQKAFVDAGGVPGAQIEGQDLLNNQALQAWAGIKTIMTQLGEGTIPGLTSAFKGLNSAISATSDFFQNHKDAAAAVGYTGEGAGALLGGWAIYKLLRRTFGGGARAAAAAAAAAPEIGAAEIGGAVAAAGWGLPALAIGGPIAAAAFASYKGSLMAAEQLKNGELPYNMIDANIDPFNIARTGGPAMSNRQSGSAENKNVELSGTAMFNGQIHVHMGDIVGIVTAAVLKGLMHASTGGTIGSTASPDMSGGMPIPSSVF